MRCAAPGLLALAVTVGSLGTSSGARADESGVTEADDHEKEAAQKQFQEAMRLYDEGKFEQALVAFRASYDVVRSPNSHLMIADTLLQLGRKAEAFAVYEETAREAEAAAETDDRYAPTAKAAREGTEALRAEVAMVSVRVVSAPEGAKLLVGGRVIDEAQWASPIAAPPGDVEVKLELRPDHATTKKVEVEAGGTGAIEIELGEPPVEPATPPPAEPVEEERPWYPRRRTGAYIAGGVGAAGLVTFGALKAAGTADDAAIAGLVIGLLGVGTGAVLWFTAGSPPDDASSAGGDAASPAHRSAPRVGVWVAPRGAAVVGEF